MRNTIFFISIFLMLSLPSLGQERITNIQGTYSFDQTFNSDKLDGQKWNIHYADVSIYFYVDSTGRGKLFLVSDGDKTKFLIMSCSPRQGEGYSFQLLGLDSESNPLALDAYITFEKGKVERFAFTHSHTSYWLAYENSTSLNTK